MDREKKAFLDHRISVSGKNMLFKELDYLGVNLCKSKVHLPEHLKHPHWLVTERAKNAEMHEMRYSKRMTE